MKNTTLLLLIFGITAFAQTKGNGNVETRTFSIENLTDLEMGLYAKVTINASANEAMIVTTDSNIFDLIDTHTVNGVLKLSQKEWIQASQKIQIFIGAPNLKRLQLGVHEKVLLKNINKESIKLIALQGKIVAIGTSKNVEFECNNGTIDGSKLHAKNAIVNIWGKGKAIVNAKEYLETDLSDNAKLELISEPSTVKGIIREEISNSDSKKLKDVEFIDLRIKNNSWNRNNFTVVGPKKDGSSFSYGFPMMPRALKKERWTTGTKIYEVNKLGGRKLLVTIKAEDENATVDLFQ